MNREQERREKKAAISVGTALGFWLAVWFLLSPPWGHSRWWAYGIGIGLALEGLVRLTWWLAKDDPPALARYRHKGLK